MDTTKPADKPDMLDDGDERISDEKVSQILEEFENESVTRQLRSFWLWFAGVLAAGLSVYALFWTQYSITTHVYRASFLAIALVLTFLLYPLRKRDSKHVPFYDLILAALSVISLGYLIFLLTSNSGVLDRITRPTPIELVMGALTLLLVLEATRRTTGWVLPVVALVFLLYAYFGPFMPEFIAHRGYRFPRIIGQNFLTLEGVFGVALDVAATYIVLFTIYGAVLEYSGAGKFFIDWSFAALGKSRSGAGPGRTATAAGFLLGTVSGSGVATTVTLGSLAWPMLKKAGYDRDTSGGILAAAGIGALLSPPTLGAAAFLIAEYLNISYLDVLIMAMIPTVLYYLSCLLMIEADSRRMQTRAVDVQTLPLLELTIKFGYHFTSLFAVAILLAIGLSPFLAVFFSIVIAFALSFLRPETRLTSLMALAAGALLALGIFLFTADNGLFRDMIRRLSNASFWGMMLATGIAALLALRNRVQRSRVDGLEENTRMLRALESGGRGVLSIAATTATAGIIVSIVTLTGLGLKISGLIVNLSGGNLFLTIVFAAIAVWVLGLAVPVTASYIIAAVMIVPALTEDPINVLPAAAHMFIFYYAVLADVSPPTALSPFAAAAITGGNPFRTMMLTWKYCMPAFLVPFMFTLSPEGASILTLGVEGSVLSAPPLTILWTFITACLAVAALAVTFGGWFIKGANMVERVLMGVGGLALLYADRTFDVVGLTVLVIAATIHLVRVRRSAAPIGAGVG
jgi:TRAP transporter 4TM/12TM fusion protein